VNNFVVIIISWRRVAQSLLSGYGLDDRTIQVRSLAEARDFFFNLCVQAGSASCRMGTGVPFPGDKAQPVRDDDYAPPSSVEVVNE
jgi:hypothetical protein